MGRATFHGSGTGRFRVRANSMASTGPPGAPDPGRMADVIATGRCGGHPSGDATIREDVLAIDPRPVLRAEKAYDIGDIFWLAQPAKRGRFRYAAKCLFPMLAQELGIDGAGRYRVN